MGPFKYKQGMYREHLWVRLERIGFKSLPYNALGDREILNVFLPLMQNNTGNFGVMQLMLHYHLFEEFANLAIHQPYHRKSIKCLHPIR
jgi:hypothetical protein